MAEAKQEEKPEKPKRKKPENFHPRGGEGRKPDPVRGMSPTCLRSALALCKNNLTKAVQILVDEMNKADNPNAPKMAKEIIVTFQQLDKHQLDRAKALLAIEAAKKANNGDTPQSPKGSQDDDEDEELEKAPVFSLTVVADKAADKKK